MTIDLILGTAGHIDHGKTSLIGALTGVDTDRLPEEKRRGITIDLGFAELNVGGYRFGIVDVPGHERFVRNMLVGATGMDLAMLVIAADDSIKQQSREHLDILRMLNLPGGLVVLTKCDLVEADWLDLVEEEVRELVSDTFLADAPIIRSSSKTGMGLDEVRAALVQAADRLTADQTGSGDGPFRLAIDRTFAMEGHGTVVTGSVSSGQLDVGDEVALQPGNHKVRVRGLQNHDRTVDRIRRGQRAAINLGGVHHGDITRGHELASPGHLHPSRLLTARLNILPSAPRPLKSRSRVRLHVGSAELLCSVILLAQPQLKQGETGLCQLLLAQPAVTTWRQPFVIRAESPVVTLGGGQILEPDAQRLRRPTEEDLEMLGLLLDEDPIQRASAALYLAGLRNWEPSDLPRTAGVHNPKQAAQALRDAGLLREIQVSPTRTFALHTRVLEHLSHRLESALLNLHARFPLRSSLEKHHIYNAFRYLENDLLLDAVLQELHRAGRIRVGPRGVAVVGQGPQLSRNERKLMDKLIKDYRQAGLQSPTVKQMQQHATSNQDSVPALIALAAADGELVQVTEDYFVHHDVDQEIRSVLTDRLQAGEGLALSEIRELLQTTRKYAVPYCEYLDRIGFTRREGDLRVLGPQATADPPIES